MPRYNPAQIEPRWQNFWEEQRTFAAPEFPQGPKLYVLDMFPYPSGDGLHVGHPEGYTATDIVCRFSRMRGHSVLHPMGFDAFGLPAEEYAIRTNTPPRESTYNNIATFRRQLKSLGFSYDWSRELATTDVEYFRWTQWIFTVLFDTWYDSEQQRGRRISELPISDDLRRAGPIAVRQYQDEHRLAYQSDALVNWCPALGTVLANEEVQDGKSERGGHPVQRIPLRQWMLRITAYADRLEKDLEQVDWPESIKKLQREWIGRSVGAEVDFFIGERSEAVTWKRQRAASGYPRKADERVLRIYTTRPDTLFGATYMVIAPEHPFVETLTTPAQRAAVDAYRQQVAAKSDRERTEVAKQKTGVFTGGYAINPVNGQQIPVWIADYVLISYGTGAIMAVPAHDTRDFEFAQQFGLPIIPVVHPSADKEVESQGDVIGRSYFVSEEDAAVLAGEACFVGEGRAINSGPYDGLMTPEFKTRITADLEANGVGREAVNYKLRDWLFSRQRFWGEPFPILHELDEQGQPTGLLRAVDPAELPVDLPPLDDYKPHGKPEPPLAKAPEQWLYPVIDGKRYRRETNTMPQWAGSCWYYLRFIDPRNDQAFVDPAKEKAWMPVDLYVGGAEHAVLHLLYSRFWHKVLYDRGHVSTAEPFRKLVNQGMILGDVEYTGYQRADGTWVSRTNVEVDAEKNVVERGTAEKLVERKLEAEEVDARGDAVVLKSNPEIRLESRAHKMSKSRGNVVKPDDIIRDYGADSLRLYEMFMGPLEQTKPWKMTGVNGVRGFLDRAWRMLVDERSETLQLVSAVQDVPMTDEQARFLHRTIKAITHDTEALSFNTAIARMMEFVNFFTKQVVRPKTAMEQFVLLMSPYAPHIAEELWHVLGRGDTLAYETWPTFDPELTKESLIEIPVQVNGKVRHKIDVLPGLSQQELIAAARKDPKVQELLAGKQLIKEIAVADRLVNFVVK